MKWQQLQLLRPDTAVVVVAVVVGALAYTVVRGECIVREQRRA